MFTLCCDHRCELRYQIHHNPAPLDLKPSMKQMIDKLLWYIPNIDSYQSTPIEIIDDPFYDDFLFRRLLHDMCMQESDILWLEGNDVVSDDNWAYFEEQICTNCQKAIICAHKNKTKTKNFLRCVRNCIAHGHFAVVHDMLIGFSVDGKAENRKKRAVIKIKPHLLLAALEHISLPSMRGQMHAELIAEAFSHVGYETLRSATLGRDFQISKNGCIYDVEIKLQAGRYTYLRDIQKYLDRINTGNPLLLVIDKSTIVKDTRNALKSTSSLIVLGREELQKLLNGEDILEITAT